MLDCLRSSYCHLCIAVTAPSQVKLKIADGTQGNTLETAKLVLTRISWKSAHSQKQQSSILEELVAGNASNGREDSTQGAGLVQDRLLVAANAALASLAGNADTHFVMVNEGAAPALVATLQHGQLHLLHTICLIPSLICIHGHDSQHGVWPLRH